MKRWLRIGVSAMVTRDGRERRLDRRPRAACSDGGQKRVPANGRNQPLASW